MGAVVGSAVGAAVGSAVGAAVGSAVGAAEGSAVGAAEGSVVGVVAGSEEGAVNIVKITRTMTMIVLIFPLIKFFRKLCHLGIGMTSVIIRSANKLETLGK
ncbi:MAG: hypothetical protein IJ422_04100 [Oscillospiraceae bacterium]|nr:hypothetical protein [Oscillospiraceae bacterium]